MHVFVFFNKLTDIPPYHLLQSFHQSLERTHYTLVLQ